jgi:hypothetical protein
MSIRICFGEQSIEVEQVLLETSCFYYEAMFKSSMRETINNTVDEQLPVKPVAWQTVLNTLKMSSDTIPNEPDAALQTLLLIDYLQPKETPEGRRLTTLAMRIITELSRSKSASLKVEALIWAMFYEHKEACIYLKKSLGFETPENIFEAISTFDLSSIEEESMFVLAGLPVLVESNRAVDCWHLWAQDNKKDELVESLKQITHPKSTSQSAALRKSLALKNSEQTEDVAMYGDMIVKGSNRVELYSWQDDLRANLEGDFQRTYFVKITSHLIIAVGRIWKGSDIMRIWDSRTQSHGLLCEISWDGGVMDAFAEHVAVGDMFGYVSIWNPRGGGKEITFLAHRSGDDITGRDLNVGFTCSSVTLLHNTIITAENYCVCELKVWDRPSVTCLKKLKNVTAHCVKEGLIYCAVNEGSIHLLDPEVSSMQTWMRLDNSVILLQKIDITGSISHMFCEGDILACFLGGMAKGRGIDSIKLCDVATGKQCNTILLPPTPYFNSVRFLSSGLMILYQDSKTIQAMTLIVRLDK